MLTEAIVGVAILVVLLLSVRVVPEGERVGVLRLGRFAGVRGPGVTLLIPVADKAIRVNLDRDIPTWRSLPSEVLEREVERLSTTSGFRI
jgi:regulator of protease activity HflC (stomatin/prohibitin superfamily)